MMNNADRNIIPRVITILSLLFGQLMLYLIGVSIVIQIIYAMLFIAVFFGQKSQGYIFIYRIATPIAIGIFFTLLYHYAYSIDYIKYILDASFRVSFLLDKYFNVVSTLYAISTAFLLWKGLSDYDFLKSELNSEASLIKCIISFTHYFEGEHNLSIVNDIKKIFVKYIKNILDGDRIVNHKKNDELLDLCISKTSEIKTEDLNDEIALSEIMKGLSDLSKIRSKRQSYIEAKMSPYLLASLLFMTISIMYPLYTKSPQEAGSAAYIMIFSMSSLLSFMFITMLDLRDPFAGFWKIKLDAFGDIIEDISNEILSSGHKKSSQMSTKKTKSGLHKK